MRSPVRYDFHIKRRADALLRLRFKDGLLRPINLDGYAIAAQVWDQARTVKYADLVLQSLDVEAGEVRLLLPAASTAELPAQCHYDVLAIGPSGLRSYPLEGVIQVREGYTA